LSAFRFYFPLVQGGLTEIQPLPLLRLSWTSKNQTSRSYAKPRRLIKRSNEMQSSIIYVRASQDGSPAAILFSNFPRSNVQVTYKSLESSAELLVLIGLKNKSLLAETLRHGEDNPRLPPEI